LCFSEDVNEQSTNVGLCTSKSTRPQNEGWCCTLLAQ
jgi:hypothetical protein